MIRKAGVADGTWVLSEQNIRLPGIQKHSLNMSFWNSLPLLRESKESCCPLHLLLCSISFFTPGTLITNLLLPPWMTPSTEKGPQRKYRPVLQTKLLKTGSGASVQTKTGRQSKPRTLASTPAGQEAPPIVVSKLQVTVTAIAAVSGRLPTLLQAR